MTDSENYGGSKQESDSGFASYGLLEKAISNLCRCAGVDGQDGGGVQHDPTCGG